MNNKNILFVDDDVMLLKGLERNLRSMRNKWNIRFSVSGEDALDLMQDEGFHCVVSDFRMTGMTGIEFLEKVKEKWPDTKRIVLSGQADAGVFKQSKDIAQEYIPKPCSVDDIIKILDRVLGDENE